MTAMASSHQNHPAAAQGVPQPQGRSPHYGQQPPLLPAVSAPAMQPKITTLTKFDENRIDSMAIPRPTAHVQNEQLTQPGGRRVPPDYGGPVYPSLAVCTYVEETDATPRYVKQSLTLVPQTKFLLNNGRIPFSLFLTPFPLLGCRECPVPQVDLSPYSPVFQQSATAAPEWGLSKEELLLRPGPLRCPACGAYACAFFQFAVRAASCHICGHNFDMPEWYALLLEEHRRQIPSESAFRDSMNSLENLAGGLELLQRPNIRTELLKGTVDFLTHSHFLHAGPSNAGTVPRPSYALGAGFDGGTSPPLATPCLVYVLDASLPAASIALPQSILNSIKYLCRSWPAGAVVDVCCILAADQIYLTTYDSALKKISGFHVLSDVRDPFLPGDDASRFVVRVECGQDTATLADLDAYIDALYRLLGECAQEFQSTELSIISATAVAVDLIKHRNRLDQGRNQTNEAGSPRICGRGGIIQVVTGGRPTLGIAAMPESPASLRNREEAAQKSSKLAWPSKKDWSVFEPHPSLATEVDGLVRAAVLASASITVFAIDANATEEDSSKMALGLYYCLVRQTGGQLYHYPAYTHANDYEKLYLDLQTEVSAGVALDVSFKLRLTKGLKASRIKCPWTCVTTENGGYGPDVSAFSVPRMHPHVGLCFDLEFTTEELPGKCTYVQAAFTYTDFFGRRCLRVINKRFMTTSTLNCVFRMSDMEAALISILRGVLLAMMAGEKAPAKIREDTDKQLTDLLLAYRLHAALTSPYGQLILPEAFKMLPIYVTALFKTSCTRTTGLMADARVLSFVHLMNAPLRATLKTLYPMLFPVHRSLVPVKGEELSRVGHTTDVFDEVRNEHYFYLPATVGTSGERVHSDSVYVLDDGQQFMIYVGADVKEEILRELRPPTAGPLAPKPCLPRCSAAQEQDPGNFLRRLWCALAQLRIENESPIYQPARLIFARSVAESEFIWKMAEDRLSAEKGYVDYLVDLHRAVQKELADV